jgi:hypothetical protein
MRATESTGPPAANGLTSVTGFDGYVWPAAFDAKSTRAQQRARNLIFPPQ